MDIQQIAKAEEESRKQKFSCLLLKKGDRNTKYIQRIANSHRRNNQIDILKEKWRPTATFDNLASLTLEEKEWLERAFEEDKILATINSCAPDKAPGPDGYTMAFYQREAIELRDYSPISLIGSVYKILAKVLAEKLETLIGKLISVHQNAFIKSSQYNITTVKYSVVVSRSSVGFFSPQKGIRQGDFLSPFLFIRAMEGLNEILDIAKQLQWIEGFTVGNNTDILV
ncbi:uncharacterized protein LOC124892947 [Capsicum annuum]|uniref:uncharacterized protein LOC124892947 n=1 Tax=Capsicum annuum TaxID=4072 RepID=UPI001FB0C0E5|nr:uncharacterized protein LOC124892947 [Capsicum annuum]